MDPFQRFLGLTESDSPFTMYRLIGVTEGESDQNTLRLALQKVGAQLKQADRTADPEGWKTVVEAVKKAQSILLSPEGNEKYFADIQARRNASRSAEGVATTASAESMSDLTPLLPVGDPNASLDIALLEATPAVATAPWFAPSEVRMQSLAKEIHGIAVPQAITGHGAAISPAALNVSSLSGSKPVMKKNNARAKSSPLSRAMPLIVLFAAAFGVLGFGVFMLYSSKKNSTLAQADRQGAVQPQNPAPAPAPIDPVMGNLGKPNNGNANKPPRRGGLPSVNEEGAPVEPIMEPPPVERPANNETPADNASNEMAEAPMNPEKPEEMPADKPAEMPEKPADPAMEPEKPIEPEKPTGNLGDLVNNEPKPAEPPTDAPPAEVKPSAAQLKQFGDSMMLARKSLSTRDIAKFETNLAKAEPNAVTQKQKKQFERLKVFGEAIKRYEEAFMASIAARSAGENIQVKNTTVGWVEGSGNKFKVRVAGDSKSYTTLTAPLGLANALIDLAISPDDPATQLSKASVAMLSAKVAGKEEVNQWLEAATAAGLIDEEFRSVIDEDYKGKDEDDEDNGG
jgi:hypothetical protein